MNNEQTIYTEAYHTWRYLDAMRYLVSLCYIVLFLFYAHTTDLTPQIYLTVGLVTLGLGWLIHKLSVGIHINSQTLNKVGEGLGHRNIPVTELSYKSVFWWVKWFALIDGACYIVYSVIQMFI